MYYTHLIVRRANETTVKSVRVAVKALREADNAVQLFIRDEQNIPRTVLLTKLNQ